jgi:hypothetical protein
MKKIDFKLITHNSKLKTFPTSFHLFLAVLKSKGCASYWKAKKDFFQLKKSKNGIADFFRNFERFEFLWIKKFDTI